MGELVDRQDGIGHRDPSLEGNPGDPCRRLADHDLVMIGVPTDDGPDRHHGIAAGLGQGEAGDRKLEGPGNPEHLHTGTQLLETGVLPEL